MQVLIRYIADHGRLHERTALRIHRDILVDPVFLRTYPSRLVAAQRHRHLLDRIEVGDVPYLRSGTRSGEMEAYRRVASAVGQRTNRHVVTGHRQRTRSRDLDIIEPS